MMTYEQVMNEVIEVDGCWYYPHNTTSWFDVEYLGKRTYLIEAVFIHYNKTWDGIAKRSCGNNRCINPHHLMNKVESFWFHIDIRGESECWVWKSSSGDYGNTHWNRKGIKAHKLAYELFYKEKIPAGMEICHTCDNPPCCNPHHLFIGTHQDNVDDREKKGRNKLPHSLGEQHGQHKLTESDIREIRKLYASGNHSYYTLSNIYGVSFGNIRNIVKRKIWSWLS